MQFRKDINGLRAVAVMAVVIFHFDASWMPGGFTGVDVFFVVSGFLMTGLIFRGLEQESFSILNFYVARANRIVPALAALCVVLLVFGWFYLIPIDYRALGKHVASSIGFLSNVVYWSESGYFSSDSHGKWLLHTWSLSAEWQFYVIYPLVLVTMRKFMSIKAMKVAILFGTLLGFVCSVIATNKWPIFSYYLLPTRAWEMMIGGVAYLYPFSLPEKRKRLVEWFGLILIVSSCFFITEETPWPGYSAIFPVLGSFLIIQAQRSDSLIASNVVLQRLGAWSYSIYLWHWPLVVAIYSFSLGDTYIYLGIGMSVLLGFISYKYIEKIRFKGNFDSMLSYLSCKPLHMVCVVGVMGSLTYITKGFVFHYDTGVVAATYEALNKNPRRDECHVGSGKVPECIYGEGKLAAIVMGDSHAQSIVRSVQKSLPVNRSVMDWTMSGCRTIENVYNIRDRGTPDYSCGHFISYALNEISKYPNIPIVISARYSYLLFGDGGSEIEDLVSTSRVFNTRSDAYYELMNNAFVDTVCAFSQKNPVVILGQTPEMKYDVPNKMAKELMAGHASFRVKLSADEYNQRHEMFEQIVGKLQDECEVAYVPVADIFCDKEFCYGDIDGRPAYFDDDHLSEFGASKLIPKFKEFIIPLLQ